jgi:ABC-type dipeptide/oligopeptide/nickel transport system ATPase component
MKRTQKSTETHFVDTLLEVKNFSVSYSVNGAKVAVVKNVSFTMKAKERVGLVGESGCGKTALVTALLGLDTAQRIEGSAFFKGNLPSIVRGREIGMVFQDPMTFLNPTMKIGTQIKEGLLFHRMASASLAEKRAIELLQLVGISEPELRAQQYPHQLSGGQRQRVLIAIALASKPKLILADEPTTSLDPSIASQILDLLKNVSEQLDMSLLLITHDLRAVASTCDRVLVMHEGQLVEDNCVEEIFYNPQHAYTKSLLNTLRLSL